MSSPIVQFVWQIAPGLDPYITPWTTAFRVPPTVGNRLVAVANALEGALVNAAGGWTLECSARVATGDSYSTCAVSKIVTAADAQSNLIQPFVMDIYGYVISVWEVAGGGAVIGAQTVVDEVGLSYSDAAITASSACVALSIGTTNAAPLTLDITDTWITDSNVPRNASFDGVAYVCAAHYQYASGASVSRTVTYNESGKMSSTLILVSGTFTPEIYTPVIHGVGITPSASVPQALPEQVNTYKIIIYDHYGHIVDLPQDIQSFSFEDVVNGGSGAGSFFVKRQYVDQGWLDYQYRVQLYLNGSTYPWYDGRIVEFDPQQFTTNDEEGITVVCEGWSTQLAYAIVSEVYTPTTVGTTDATQTVPFIPAGATSVAGGVLDADVYLNHILSTYVDNASFRASVCPSLPIILDALSFDGTNLDSVIDQIVKQVLADSTYLYEWWVRGSNDGGLPGIVIQPQQLPPTTGTSASYFAPPSTVGPLRGSKQTNLIVEFKNSTIYEDMSQNVSRGLYNMIALYGGVVNNVQIYGSFKDSVSMACYGTRQQKVTNSNLMSSQTLATYAAAYLLQNGYPQPQGSFKKVYIDDFARAGQWFQILEGGVGQGASAYDGRMYTSAYIGVPQAEGSSVTTGANAPSELSGGGTFTRPAYGFVPDDQMFTTAAASSKPCRAIRVLVTMQEQTHRIEQQVFTTAPRPFIDHIFYGAINYTLNSLASAAGAQNPAQLLSYFITDGAPSIAPTTGATSSNLIPDPLFNKGTVWDTNGHSNNSYSTVWSFGLIDNISFWIQNIGTAAAPIGQLQLGGAYGGQSLNCTALSKAFAYDPGTYTLSFTVNRATADGLSPSWSLVKDRGQGIWASAYGSADIIAGTTAIATVGATHTVTLTWTNTGVVPLIAHVFFQSNGVRFMTTGNPVLAFTAS